ncbi:nuclear transport factor 2 family protein [Scytonema sp. NUACC21]
MKDTSVQQVIDQANIISTINHFWFSVDTRDYDAMRSCLTEQVDFDYSALYGTSMPSKADELVEEVRRDHDGFQATQHVTTNHYVTINGDTAQCIANFQVQHFLPNDRISNFWRLGGRYVFSLLRTQDGWKIHGCVINVSWTDGDLQLVEIAHEQSQQQRTQD